MHKFDKHEKYNNIIKTIFLFRLTVGEKKTKNKIPKKIKTIAPKPTNKKKNIILL
jgi:hypothetical protein